MLRNDQRDETSKTTNEARLPPPVEVDAVNKDNLTPLLLAEKPKTPNPADMGDSDVYKPKRNSKEEVIAALRELMHHAPKSPAPQPPPLPADKD